MLVGDTKGKRLQIETKEDIVSKSNFSNEKMTLEPCLKLEDQDFYLGESFKYSKCSTERWKKWQQGESQDTGGVVKVKKCVKSSLW